MELEIQLANGETRESHYPSEASALELERLLDDRGIPYKSTGSGDSAWWSILTYLLPFLLFFGFWIFMMSRVQEKRSDSRRGLSDGSARDPDDLR
jgi:ATP-dependent Zn protease